MFYNHHWACRHKRNRKIATLYEKGVNKDIICEKLNVYPWNVCKVINTLTSDGGIWRDSIFEDYKYIGIRNKKLLNKSNGKWIVYAIVCPRTKEVRYIGKTSNIYDRFTIHLNSISKKTKVQRWIQTLKGDSPRIIINILEVCPKNLINKKESKWIKYYFSRGKNLLNIQGIK